MEIVVDTNIFVTIDRLYLQDSRNERFKRFRFFYPMFFNEFIKNGHTLVYSTEIEKEYLNHFKTIYDERTIFAPSSAEQFFGNLKKKKIPSNTLYKNKNHLAKMEGHLVPKLCLKA